MIIHIDMDAFFASIEQAINPKLKNKPLIVGSRGNKMHTVVCAASYEAKAYGISSGMTSAEAFKICPNLEFVAADQSKYIWTSTQILELLKEYGFAVNYASIDEFQIDIPNTPDLRTVAEEIQEEIFKNFNITASIGIAKNWILAKLASKIKKPKGITILTEENLNLILDKTTINKLCGMGGKIGQALYESGIKTCLDLYQKNPSFLKERLGQYGLNIYGSLHSNGHFDLSNEPKPKSISHSYTFPMASQNPVFIKAWIRLLSEMVAERLRSSNLTASTVHLWLNGPEIGNFGAQKTYQEATNDGCVICERCLKIMDKTAQNKPKIRAIGVNCSKLQEQNYTFLFKEDQRREALIKAVDKINNRYGDNLIYPAITAFTRKM
ncbi:MAG: DNA polymerase IV [Candidatus Omnitrophica bacterium]|nr:DNA polymerase IV [Candidatus Omnitrophota bacterium]